MVPIDSQSHIVGGSSELALGLAALGALTVVASVALTAIICACGKKKDAEAAPTDEPAEPPPPLETAATGRHDAIGQDGDARQVANEDDERDDGDARSGRSGTDVESEQGKRSFTWLLR